MRTEQGHLMRSTGQATRSEAQRAMSKATEQKAIGKEPGQAERRMGQGALFWDKRQWSTEQAARDKVQGEKTKWHCQGEETRW
jgi:hypothetical protein